MFAIADLTPAYKSAAQKVERGIAMLDRRAVLVQDEITATNPVELWWFLHTPATIEIDPAGTNAVLSLHGKRLAATVISPSSARFPWSASGTRSPPSPPAARSG